LRKYGSLPSAAFKAIKAIKLANSNTNYTECGALNIRDDPALLQFTEKPRIHVYLLLKYTLLAFNDTLERHALHTLKI